MAIAFILCISLYVPAYAQSWTTLIPGDYIKEVFYEGNFRSVRYDFGITPLLKYTGANGAVTNGNGTVTISSFVDGANQRYSIYPLGANAGSGPPLSNNASGRIAIDISDFKNNAALTLNSALQFELDLVYNSFSQELNERIVINVVWSFLGYNSSGNFVGTLDTLNISENATIQDMSSTYTLEFPFSLTMGLSSFSEPVSYIVPVCNVTLVISENEVDIQYVRTIFSCDNFTLTGRTDMLLQDSITMEKVEEHLSSLNDKTDTIISGTPEQNETANSGSNKVQDTEQDIDQMMSQLDEMGDYDTSSAFNTINNFLSSPGWYDVRDLLAPLIDWEYNTTLMLIAAAFATISIILFGR